MALLVAAPLICVSAGAIAVASLADLDEEESLTEGERMHLRECLSCARNKHPLNMAEIVVPATTLFKAGGLGLTIKSFNNTVVVYDLEQEGLAAHYGISVNDWITSINGTVVLNAVEVKQLIDDAISRGLNLHVAFMRRRTLPRFNITNKYENLGATFRDEAGGVGVLVSQLDPCGHLAQCGLQQGDIILSINGDSVEDHESLAARLFKKPMFKSSKKPRFIQLVIMTSPAAAEDRRSVPAERSLLRPRANVWNQGCQGDTPSANPPPAYGYAA